jgi:5-(carboxyamino)imidazole ribonucleotide synthase
MADTRSSSVLVAVLGGGQLGRMLGLAGIPLGLHFRFLDPVAAAPAAAVGELIVGPLGDETALTAVARDASVVTYEWEGVPAEAVRFLDPGVPVRPGARSLAVSQDRLAEKETFRRLGIDTPPFAAVDDRVGLTHAVGEVGGLPAVLKTRRGGYDGKGQRVLHHEPDLDDGWAELGGVPLILEALVPFERELSVLAVRGLDDTVACWPLVENHHDGGILRLSRAPAPGLDAVLQQRAEQLVSRVLSDLDHVGVLAVELFDVGGELLANEIAPRVHNSGHWTIEGSETSQFENHLRAILGLPLGSTAARGSSAMLNCIGVMPDPDAVLAVSGTHLHDYGKTPRPGRKLGHVTVTAADDDQLTARLVALTSRLSPAA